MKGAAIAKTPIPAQIPRAHPIRQESESDANRINKAPSVISVKASQTSSTPIVGGCVTSQTPSAILTKCAQR